MLIIRPQITPKPFVMSNLNFTSSDVAESEYTAYSTVGAVVVGDKRQVVSPSAAVTFTIASPCVMTWNQSQLPDNTAVSFTTSGTLPTGITAGAIYYVKQLGDSTYNLRVAASGSPITTSGSQAGTHTATATLHNVYEALLPSATSTGSSIAGTVLTIAGTITGAYSIGQILSGTGVTANTTITAFISGTGGAGTYTVSVSQTVGSTAITGVAPVTDSNSWARADSTNRWRMFDSSTSSQTANVGAITVVETITGLADAVALLNVSCAEATVVMTDPTDGVVYNTTKSGVEISGIIDHYHYCFDPIMRKTDLLFDDLPNYANVPLTITLTGSASETVLCGLCFAGKTVDAGGTQYGMNLGIQDYSVKEQDAYGNYTINERSYSRKVNLLVNVNNGAVDALHNFLASFRAIPAVYIGSTMYGSSFVFGFYKEFNIEIPHPAYSLCSIEIEGLT